MKKNVLMIISTLISFGFCSIDKSEFIFNKKMSTSNSLELNIDIDDVTEINGFKKITNNTSNHTIDSGLPELPTYTTFYQLDVNKEYEIEMIIHDSYIIENMKIIPQTWKCINELQNRGIQIGVTTGFDKEQMNLVRLLLERNDIILDN